MTRTKKNRTLMPSPARTLVPFYEDDLVTLYVGDVREVLSQLPEGVAQASVSSPPYWGLRDYSVEGQIGLEASPKEFVDNLVGKVYEDVRRVLSKDGICWVNLGDSYSSQAGGYDTSGSRGTSAVISANTQAAVLNGKQRTPPDGLKPKDLCGIPWRVALAMQDAGWWWRQWFPWVKRSAMPGSQTDRATTATEVWFQFTRSKSYYYDEQAVRVEGSGFVPGNKSHIRSDVASTPDPLHRPQNGLVAYAERQRDRSNGNRNGECGHLDNTPAGSRSFRNTDLWFESIKPAHGLVGAADEIVGIDCNPAGFSAEFCTACGRYYHDAKDKKEIVREEIDGKIISTCICGASGPSHQAPWLSHFATFPQKLIEPLIKCSTSEKGQCIKCKKAWVRVIEKEKQNLKLTNDTGKVGAVVSGKMDDFMRPLPRARTGEEFTWDIKTLGWQPQCDCDADTEPQTVLEPFSGAGTTMIVAAKLGRRCIAIELNEDYARMSVERYKREMQIPVDPPRRTSNTPLFENQP